MGQDVAVLANCSGGHAMGNGVPAIQGLQCQGHQDMLEEVHELVGDNTWHPWDQDAWHKMFLTSSYGCIFEVQHPPQHLMMCRSTFLLQSDMEVLPAGDDP